MNLIYSMLVFLGLQSIGGNSLSKTNDKFLSDEKYVHVCVIDWHISEGYHSVCADFFIYKGLSNDWDYIESEVAKEVVKVIEHRMQFNASYTEILSGAAKGTYEDMVNYLDEKNIEYTKYDKHYIY